MPPLLCAPAGPRAALLPPSRGRHSPRGNEAGPGRPPLCRCRAAEARRGEARFHFLWRSFFAAPSCAEPRRLCLPRHSSLPAPRRRLPAKRSEGKGCETVPSCRACRAGQRRLSRHRPALLPAGALRRRQPRGHRAQPRLHPFAFLCGTHLPCSGATRPRGARRKGLLLFRGLTCFVRPSPAVNCSNEEVREGWVCGSSLHVLQHNKDPLDSLLAPNARQERNAGNVIIITP